MVIKSPSAPPRSPFTVAWNNDQRAALEQLARSRTAPLRRVQRAKAALAAADGVSNTAIARELGVHVATVRRWRKRCWPTTESHPHKWDGS